MMMERCFLNKFEFLTSNWLSVQDRRLRFLSVLPVTKQFVTSVLQRNVIARDSRSSSHGEKIALITSRGVSLIVFSSVKQLVLDRLVCFNH
jgi:hypothetical protein